jgi:hypothetical protein
MASIYVRNFYMNANYSKYLYYFTGDGGLYRRRRTKYAKGEFIKDMPANKRWRTGHFYHLKNGHIMESRNRQY